MAFVVVSLTPVKPPPVAVGLSLSLSLSLLLVCLMMFVFWFWDGFCGGFDVSSGGFLW